MQSKAVLFNAPISPKGKARAPGKDIASRKLGQFPGRQIFRIDGASYTIDQCLERTGMEEKEFRKMFGKVCRRKSYGWSDFKNED